MGRWLTLLAPLWVAVSLCGALASRAQACSVSGEERDLIGILVVMFQDSSGGLGLVDRTAPAVGGFPYAVETLRLPESADALTRAGFEAMKRANVVGLVPIPDPKGIARHVVPARELGCYFPGYWNRIYASAPGGYLWVSRIAYMDEERHAAVYVDVTRGPKDGEGWLIIFERSDGGWRANTRMRLWAN